MLIHTAYLILLHAGLIHDSGITGGIMSPRKEADVLAILQTRSKYMSMTDNREKGHISIDKTKRAHFIS